jgi:signal transduction histidine kinase
LPDFSDLQAGLPVLAAILGAMVLITFGAGLVSSRRRRRQAASNLAAIDFVRNSFASRLARGDPIDELLAQVVESLCDTFKLDAAELWLHDAGVLTIAACSPARSKAELKVTAAEESIIANARVSGAPWAKVWLQGLLEGRADAAAVRIAPVSVTGRLLGLIVVERRRRGESLAADADITLEELAREVGAGLNKQRLDAALHASLEELRRQADELQASRARIVVAADAERRRIERDLHDGAQQYLVAIAVKARLIQQLARSDPAGGLALTQDMIRDIESALDELRTLAQGIYPPLLISAGLAEALAAACRRTAIPVRLEADGVGRYPPELEAAVYYCCIEALQNASKHAGPGASATLRLWNEGDALRFEVDDDGAGFETETQPSGAGLANMSDRIGAVGGTLQIQSTPGTGTRVHGAVPAGASTQRQHMPAEPQTLM